jgi:hypothetical protein
LTSSRTTRATRAEAHRAKAMTAACTTVAITAPDPNLLFGSWSGLSTESNMLIF